MKEDQAAKIILIRAVEECDKEAFLDDDLKNAFSKAGNRIGDANWFVNRATYLTERLSPTYKSILQMLKIPDRFLIALCFFLFTLGIFTNYIGPPGKIHVIFNPILILVGWNYIIYSLLIVGFVYPWFDKSKETKKIEVLSSDSGERGTSYKKPLQKSRNSHLKIPWKFRVFFPSLWIMMSKVSTMFSGTTLRVKEFGCVITNFWSNWSVVADSLLIARWRRVLHCGSIFLVLGAILGIYLRGVFYEYNVVWTSTFIRDEQTISVLIKLILWPGMFFYSFVIQNIKDSFDLSALFSQNGAPAASWIHLYVITAIAVIVLPRFALVLWETRKIKNLSDNININFDEYYGKTVESQLKHLIKQETQIAFSRFSEGVAAFVCVKLYDEKIIPELEAFRGEGGKIVDLKNHIKEICDQFGPEMESYISKKGMDDFRRTLASSIEHIVSDTLKDFSVAGVSEDDLSVKSPGDIIGKSIDIGDNFTDTISAIVTVSIAMVVGTISGGFGESVGIAIIASLTGVTGPLGFVIGAFVGFIAAGAGWWFGKGKITGTIENVNLPGWVLRKVLWESKYKKIISEGRDKTHESVKKELYEKMYPHLGDIGNNIWLKVKNLWD